MTADLSVLQPRLVLLAGGSIDLAGLPCSLCSTPVLPGAFLPALAYSDRRAGFTCPRCARDVDPVVAELAAALNTVDALIEGLDDAQHRSGLAHGLSLLIGRLTAPVGEPCPTSPAGDPGPNPSPSDPK